MRSWLSSWPSTWFLLALSLAACRVHVTVDSEVGGTSPPSAGQFKSAAPITRLGLAPAPKYVSRGPEGWAREAIGELSARVISAIARRDGIALAALVHPVKGLRISPYASAQGWNDLVFTARELPTVLRERHVYPWGRDPVTHALLSVSPTELFDRTFGAVDWSLDYVHFRELDETDDRFDLFPRGVTARYEHRSKSDIFDERALELVFVRWEKEHRLVAIAHATRADTP